jgi:sugar O-acyltransferase (sialic acid O-acetyltransferase NeuD family)
VDRKVVIIGAGDHGRGVLEILREASRTGPRVEVVGFVDDAPNKHGASISGVPVLGGIDWIRSSRETDMHYVIAVADTRIKAQIARRLDQQPLAFETAIHPSVILAGGVRVEPGSILNAGVVVAYDTLICAHSTVNLNATVGHDCILGRFSTVAPGANIAGHVRVGEGGDVGMNATVAAGVTIGEWSSVALGSVVMKDVAAGQRVFGNPARLVPTTSFAHT